MSNMEAIDYFRGFNAVLGIVCFWLLVVRLLGVWRKLAGGQRILFSSILMWMVTVFWGSLELIYQDAPASYRVIVNSVALMLLLIYLIEPRSRYSHRLGRNPLGGDDFRTNRGTPDATL